MLPKYKLENVEFEVKVFNASIKVACDHYASM